MTGLYQDGFVDGLRQGLARHLGDWGLPLDSDLRLLTLSENATFLGTDPSGARAIFRVHRPGYHSHTEIASELDWIDALRADQTVDTPAILTRLDGGRIGQFDHAGETRHVVAFAYMEGTEPDPDSDLTDGFVTLGAISARLHAHAQTWTPPAGFTRKTWDWQAAFGPQALWGDWRAAPGLDAPGRAFLDRLALRLQDRCAAFGTGSDRFGLIHADLRLANLLIQGAHLGVIDFDDCGFGWYGYDFAAAVSFIEHSSQVPALYAAWVDGYATLAPLDAETRAMMPDFVMFRRLLLTAWVASHAETETAAWAGHERYTAGTLDLAERYFSDPNSLLR